MRAFRAIFFSGAAAISTLRSRTEDYAYQGFPGIAAPWMRASRSGRCRISTAGGGNAWMVTYSVPFFRKLSDARREMAGVVTRTSISMDEGHGRERDARAYRHGLADVAVGRESFSCQSAIPPAASASSIAR